MKAPRALGGTKISSVWQKVGKKKNAGELGGVRCKSLWVILRTLDYLAGKRQLLK